MYKRTIEDFLDDVSDGIVVGHPFNIATLLGALSASLGEMTCFLSDDGGSYSEKVKVINRIRPQLEQFKISFQKLSQIFNNHYKKLKVEIHKSKEDDRQSSDEEINILNSEIAELYIDLLKYSNEVLALIKSIMDFVKKKNLTNLLTSTVLIKSLLEIGMFNLNIYSQYLTTDNKNSVSRRAEMLNQDIVNTSNLINGKIKELVK